MPELPEVETVARELNTALRGRVITSVQIFTDKIIGMGPKVLSPKRQGKNGQAKVFINQLVGKKFLAVNRRAKLLLFTLSQDLVLACHLKMTGQFIFEDKILRKSTGGFYRIFNKLSAPKVKLPYKHTHVVFEFLDGSHLYFNDVRKFGYLKLLNVEQTAQLPEFTEYGHEPLSKEFTFDKFVEVLKYAKKMPVKQALMNNRLVVGIGNIYSDEILFHARMNPRRKTYLLSGEELKRIYRQIRLVLKKAIKAKGSSVGDFVRTDGSWGKMGKLHFVYGRKKQKCKVCAWPIESAKIGGRTSSFCPKCQR